jgi:glycosyltransferase involved in cell wall biosynthesis
MTSVLPLPSYLMETWYALFLSMLPSCLAISVPYARYPIVINAPAHLHGATLRHPSRDLTQLRVAICYKNFQAQKGISHIGLGVAALNNAKVLRALGVAVDVWPITSCTDIHTRLETDGAGTTHIVISAPWIPTLALQTLTGTYSNVQFVTNCHSNVGFLQADAHGVQRFREALALQQGTWNFQVAGNSPRFVGWVEAAFGLPCLWLPNLYYLQRLTPSHRPPWHGGALRIGSFSAIRPLKNILTAAAAALEMGREERADLEFWLSGGRLEGGGTTIEQAIQAMYHGLPHATVVVQPWQSWPHFRQTVAHMHLLLMPSYTESFQMVAADAIAEGVAVVGSDALYWLPRAWQATSDDAQALARVGRTLLHHPHAGQEGLAALQAHDEQGEQAWLTYLLR